MKQSQLLKPTLYLVVVTLLWLLAAPWLLFPTAAPTLTVLSLILLLPALAGNRIIRGRFVRPTPFDGFIVFYLAMTAVALAISPLPATGLPKLTVTTLGALGYYLLQEWTAEKPAYLWPFTALLAAGGGAIAVAGLFVLEWPSRQIINLQAFTDRLPHLSGSFVVNHNEMAGTLLLLLPLAFAWWSARRPNRLVGLGLVLVMAAVLILTQSRAAFLALAVAVALSLVWGRFPLRWLAAAAVAPLLFFPLLLALTPLERRDLTAGLVALDAGSKSGDVEPVSWLARLEIWRNAAHMAADYPVFGAGLYTFDPISRLNYPYQIIQPNVSLAHAHNLILETAATTGWPAALALAGLWLAAGAGLWQAVRQLPPDEGRLARLYSASLVGYLAFNLFDAITLGQKPGVLVWFVLAGTAVLLRRAGIPSVRYQAAPALLVLGLLCLTPALDRNLANRALDRLRLQGTSAGAAGLDGRLQGDPRRLGLLAFHLGDETAALAHWQADEGAIAFLGSQGRELVAKGQYEEAIAWCSAALALDGTAAWPAYWRGRAYEATGQLEAALVDYETAARNGAAYGLNRSWQARLYYSWGRLLALGGNWAAAEAAFRQATVLHPEISWHHFFYWETH